MHYSTVWDPIRNFIWTGGAPYIDEHSEMVGWTGARLGEEALPGVQEEGGVDEALDGIQEGGWYAGALGEEVREGRQERREVPRRILHLLLGGGGQIHGMRPWVANQNTK